jgi:hypothetical protein
MGAIEVLIEYVGHSEKLYRTQSARDRKSVLNGSGSSATTANKSKFHFLVGLRVHVRNGYASESGRSRDGFDSRAASDGLFKFWHQEGLNPKVNLVNAGKSVNARSSDFFRGLNSYFICGVLEGSRAVFDGLLRGESHAEKGFILRKVEV